MNLSMDETVNKLLAEASTAESQRHLQRAIDKYEEIIKIKPDYDMAYFKIGVLLQQVNNHSAAIEYIQKATAIHPAQSQYLFALCVSFYYLGQYRESFKAINSAIKIGPPEFKFFEHRAIILSALNCYDDSFEAYKQCLEIFPGNKEACLDGISFLANSMMHKSLFVVDNDLERTKSHKLVKKALAFFVFLSQREEEKISASGSYHAGLILKFLGDRKKALDYWAHARALFPDWHGPKLAYSALRKQLALKKEPTTLNQAEDVKTLIVHIGYPKAGSTWLQGAFFPNLCGVNHLGESQYDFLTIDNVPIATYGFPLKSSLIYKNLVQDDYNEDKAATLLKKNIGSAPITSISSEGLVTQAPSVFNRLLKLKAKLNIEIKILIIIRRQKEMVLSTYAQGMETGQYLNKTLDQVIDWNGTRENKTDINIPHYNYGDNYNLAVRYFGRQNVLMVPFEKLFSQRFDLINPICSFIDRAQDQDIIKLMQAKPPLNTGKHKAYIDKLNPDKETILAKVYDCFKASNEKLDHQLNLGLKELGYY